MPFRTCIGCRQREEQSELLRIAPGVDGHIGPWSGNGRSAYVHPLGECIQKALEKDRLDRTLRTRVSQQEKESLRQELLCRLR